MIWGIERALAQINLDGKENLIPDNLSATDAADIPFKVADRIVSTLITISYPLAFLALLFCAYLLISSAGNPDAYAKVKKNVMNVVIGVFLIVFP